MIEEHLTARYDKTLERINMWIDKTLESTRKEYSANDLLSVLKDIRERLIKTTVNNTCAHSEESK